MFYVTYAINKNPFYILFNNEVSKFDDNMTILFVFITYTFTYIYIYMYIYIYRKPNSYVCVYIYIYLYIVCFYLFQRILIVRLIYFFIYYQK
jgi:hypothetical protein